MIQSKAYAFIDSQSLKYKESQHRRSVETLGLSGNGDIKNIAKSGTMVKPKSLYNRGEK